MIPPATDDFRLQAQFVADNAWRLLSLQDTDPLSPSHGCFHYAYWRDKTSEFADARFQEAGATLALLSLPAFDAIRRDPSERLYAAFSAALSNLERQQYADGCYDEWYKGERGFAATEFTTIAYGLAARFLGPRLQDADRARMASVLAKAGGWLARRHDRVKANHEAAAAAALALAWEVTGDPALKTAARDKLDDTLRRQTPEGWFPEVGGMDLGYCSVLLDYVMIYTAVTGDETGVPAMRRLFAFMLPHIHPDGTISPEAGLCLNPYVSRLGLGLLSAWDDDAAALVAHLRHTSPGRGGLTPTLADDLRFCRWSHLPLAVLCFADRFRAEDGGRPFPTRQPPGWTVRTHSLIAAWHDGDRHLHFAPAGGGVLRAFDGVELVFEDRGLSLSDASGNWGSVGYDPSRKVTTEAEGLAMASALRPAAFFYPSFLARLILRLGCVFAWSSYLMRAMIDAYRLRARTAINQSAAPVAKGAETYAFSRTVTPGPSEIVVLDRVASRGPAIDTATLRLSHSAAAAALPAGPCRVIEVRKTIPAGGGPVRVEIDGR